MLEKYRIVTFDFKFPNCCLIDFAGETNCPPSKDSSVTSLTRLCLSLNLLERDGKVIMFMMEESHNYED